MAFNFFKKSNGTQVRTETTSEEVEFTPEDLDKVDGGYHKTQDDINKILAESTYVRESLKSELNDMLNDGESVKESKSVRK